MSYLQLTVNRNLVKYAAGTTMFCPLCDGILDARSTVVIGAGQVQKVVCAPCWDSELKPRIQQRPGVLERCEILDGRELFKKPSRRTVGTGAKKPVQSVL